MESPRQQMDSTQKYSKWNRIQFFIHFFRSIKFNVCLMNKKICTSKQRSKNIHSNFEFLQYISKLNENKNATKFRNKQQRLSLHFKLIVTAKKKKRFTKFHQICGASGCFWVFFLKTTLIKYLFVIYCYATNDRVNYICIGKQFECPT